MLFWIGVVWFEVEATEALPGWVGIMAEGAAAGAEPGAGARLRDLLAALSSSAGMLFVVSFVDIIFFEVVAQKRRFGIPPTRSHRGDKPGRKGGYGSLGLCASREAWEARTRCVSHMRQQQGISSGCSPPPELVIFTLKGSRLPARRKGS